MDQAVKNGIGNLTQYRDPRSISQADNTYLTQYQYNERDLLTQVTDPLSFSTYYDYDSNGNLTAVRDARSGSSTDNTYKTSYTYNENDQIISATDPLGKITSSYSYDNAGNETAITQPSGSVTGKTYDGANRLYQLLYDGSLAYTFGYDQAGNVARVDNGPGGSSPINWQYAYDKGNRLTNITEYLAPNQPFSYANTYDKNSNRTKLTAGGQVYNYTYNANNWMTSASDTFGTTNLYYDDKGNKVGTEFPGGLAKTYRVFDNNNRPTTISNYNGGNLFNEYAYTYDPLGNILSESSGGQSTNYTYDQLNRLDTWYNPATAKYSKYLYDPAGNVTKVQEATSQSGPWTDIKNYSYNAASELTNSGYIFDASGNQTEDANNEYFYDADNWLTGVVKKSDILLEDSFNDGNSNGWNVDSGTWAVELGEYSASASSGFVSSQVNQSYADFSYEARIKPIITGTNYWRAGLILRSQDANNYYVLGIYEGGVFLHKRVNGTWSNLATAPQTLDPNAWYKLRVETVGTTIKGYFDNRLQFTITDTTFASGKFGLAAWGDSYPIHVHFDYVKVANREIASYAYDYKGRRISKTTPTGLLTKGSSSGKLEEDLFNRANGGLGADWTNDTSNISTAISSNQLQFPYNSIAPAVVKNVNQNPLTQADYVVQSLVSASETKSSGNMVAGIMGRYSGTYGQSSNYMYQVYVYFNGTPQIKLFKVVANTSMQLGASWTISPVPKADTKYLVKLEMAGNSLKVYWNGGTAPVISAADSSVTSAGLAGYSMSNGVSDEYINADNFEVYKSNNLTVTGLPPGWKAGLWPGTAWVNDNAAPVAEIGGTATVSAKGIQFPYNGYIRVVDASNTVQATSSSSNIYGGDNWTYSLTGPTKATYYHYDGNNVIAETDENNNVTARYAYQQGDYKPYSMTRYNGGTPTTYYYLTNSRGDTVALVDQSGNIAAKYSYDPWGKILSITDPLIYSDDFNDGNYSGWTVSSGTWSIENGQLKGVRTDGGYDSWIYTGSDAWTDYVFEAKPIFVSGNAEFVFRSTAHWQNEYRLTLWSQSSSYTPNHINLARYKNSAYTLLTDITSPIPITNPSTVKIVVSGAKIDIYLNSTLVISLTDSNPLLNGKIGLGAIWNWQANFDDVKVRTLKESEEIDVSSNPSHIANINPYRYAGYRYDSETGLYYLLARYYDPSTMRFLTKDPDPGKLKEPLSLNPYIYAEDNPVNNIDPDGKWRRTLTGDQIQDLRDGLLIYSSLDAMGAGIGKVTPRPLNKLLGQRYKKFMRIRKMLRKYTKKGATIARSRTDWKGGAYFYVNGKKGPYLNLIDRKQFEAVLMMGSDTGEIPGF